MKTYATKQSEVTRSWRVVDADGATLGRLATEVAAILRGKHKTMFSPHPPCFIHRTMWITARGKVDYGHWTVNRPLLSRRQNRSKARNRDRRARLVDSAHDAAAPPALVFRHRPA